MADPDEVEQHGHVELPPGPSAPAPAKTPRPATEAERDTARVYALLLNAEAHADAFVRWLDGASGRVGQRDRYGVIRPAWLRYAPLDVQGVPWLTGEAAGFLYPALQPAVRDAAEAEAHRAAIRFDPAAADALARSDSNATLTDLLVELDYLRDVIHAFGRRYGALVPDEEARYRPEWAAAFLPHLRGVDWALCLVESCLRGDVCDDEWNAAWDLMAARHAAAGWSGLLP